MTATIFLLAGFVFFTVIVGVIFIKKRSNPVHSVDKSTSLNERMFLPVLEKAVGGQYEIIAKVLLSEVLEPAENLSKRAQRKALKSIQGRQFDFIVIDKQNRSVICAVELDEHKFDKKTFKKQDLYLEDLCRRVGLPLMRVPSQRGYNLSELIERYERIIEPSIVNAEVVSSSNMVLSIRRSFRSVSA